MRVAVIASASGNGKTTVGRALTDRLGIPFHELDALHHGPNWTEATAAELRQRVEPILRSDAWVVDGVYRNKLGDLVLEHADVVVWLDLPVRVWLPRLLWRNFPDGLRHARSSGTATARSCGTPSTHRTRSSSTRFATIAIDAVGTPSQLWRASPSCAFVRRRMSMLSSATSHGARPEFGDLFPPRRPRHPPPSS